MQISFDISALVAASGLKNFYVLSRGFNAQNIEIIGCQESDSDLVKFSWGVYGQKGNKRAQDPLRDVLVADLRTKGKADQLAKLLTGGSLKVLVNQPKDRS
jgi:hypothetical protein